MRKVLDDLFWTDKGSILDLVHSFLQFFFQLREIAVEIPKITFTGYQLETIS